jgi:hypothetical protein
MPTARNNTLRRHVAANTFRQPLLMRVASHVVTNAGTSVLGFTMGVPDILEGYASRNWKLMGEGVGQIVLGLMGDDRFGTRRPAPDQTTPLV